MKIMWLCNIMLPVIAKEMAREGSVVGGWLSGIYDRIDDSEELELVVCFPDRLTDKVYNGKVGKNGYWAFPQKREDFTQYNSRLEEIFAEIVSNEKPDVIHIFGTEYPHTSAMVNACDKLGVRDKVIVSIQGLVSVYARHYYAGVPFRVAKSYTFRDLVRRDNILKQADKYVTRGIFEKDAIAKVKHIIGRTDFDKACVYEINRGVNYYHCNENMRTSFYGAQWNYEACEKHSVFFVNQSNYPIKGFHYVLEAISMLKEKYPDIKVYTTGNSPLTVGGIKQRLRQGSYERFLIQEIKRRNLQDNIVFCGVLDEKAMVERLLATNCFLLPSTVENSPNSLGEAMLLGVPCVASDVGGVKNMITHEKEGYVYPSEAPYMMAYYIGKVFEMGDSCTEMSNCARQHAWKTHDVEENNKVLFNIYQQVMDMTRGDM